MCFFLKICKIAEIISSVKPRDTMRTVRTASLCLLYCFLGKALPSLVHLSAKGLKTLWNPFFADFVVFYLYKRVRGSSSDPLWLFNCYSTALPVRESVLLKGKVIFNTLEVVGVVEIEVNGVLIAGLCIIRYFEI